MQTAERRIGLVGALAGAFASAYLLVDYVFGSGICLTGSGCDVVRASAFAYPLGIPMPLLGLAFYAIAVVLLLASPTRTLAGLPAGLIGAGWSVAGVAVMAGLTAIELFVIEALCGWCLLSALASLLLAWGAISAWRHGEPQAPIGEARSSRARRRQRVEADRCGADLRRFAAWSGGILGIALLALVALPVIATGSPVSQADVGSVDRPRLGDGAVEAVVYSDFQCPACAVAAPVLSSLAHEGEITLTCRFFPLVSIHANAMAAAKAAHAASAQGRFWEFHDALFARQAAWADLPASEADAAFEAIATEIGLDVGRWRTDAASSSVAGEVTADLQSAQELRLSGTPTIFIDGTRYGGALNRDALLSAIEAAGAES
ncbi:MAG: vitamin K epoxide reductase family protein [Candidatus Limnocylindria bacterium]